MNSENTDKTMSSEDAEKAEPSETASTPPDCSFVYPGAGRDYRLHALGAVVAAACFLLPTPFPSPPDGAYIFPGVFLALFLLVLLGSLRNRSLLLAVLMSLALINLLFVLFLSVAPCAPPRAEINTFSLTVTRFCGLCRAVLMASLPVLFTRMIACGPRSTALPRILLAGGSSGLAIALSVHVWYPWRIDAAESSATLTPTGGGFAVLLAALSLAVLVVALRKPQYAPESQPAAQPQPAPRLAAKLQPRNALEPAASKRRFPTFICALGAVLAFAGYFIESAAGASYPAVCWIITALASGFLCIIGVTRLLPVASKLLPVVLAQLGGLLFYCIMGGAARMYTLFMHRPRIDSYTLFLLDACPALVCLALALILYLRPGKSPLVLGFGLVYLFCFLVPSILSMAEGVSFFIGSRIAIGFLLALVAALLVHCYASYPPRLASALVLPLGIVSLLLLWLSVGLLLSSRWLESGGVGSLITILLIALGLAATGLLLLRRD